MKLTKEESKYLLETLQPKLEAIGDILKDEELLKGTDLTEVYEERQTLLTGLIEKLAKNA